MNEGLTLYFLCGLDSQKTKNLAREDRAEAEKVLRMLPLKYPEARPLPMKMPSPDEVRLFRVTPSIISGLDVIRYPDVLRDRMAASGRWLLQTVKSHSPVFCQAQFSAPLLTANLLKS